MMERGWLAVFGGQRLHQRVPRIAAARIIGESPLQEKDVGDDFGSGSGFHGAFRQSDGANEIGHGCDMLAGLLIGLVHGPAAGDKGGEAAGFQPLDRAGDKIIMQGESETAGRIIGTYGAITERRIADGESVGLRQTRLGEIFMPDPGVRIKESGDARG